MTIQNIQITQWLFHAIEGKSGSGKEKDSAESNVSMPDTTLYEVQTQIENLSDNSNLIDIYCPPLFPLGHTQGIYEIKSDNSSADSREAKKAEVSEGNKANTEDITARQQVASDKKGVIKSNALPVKEIKDTVNEGSVFDLKV